MRAHKEKKNYVGEVES